MKGTNMTIKELYEWACREGVENCDIVAYDYYGSKSNNVEPCIEHNKYQNGIEYVEVEIIG